MCRQVTWGETVAAMSPSPGNATIHLLYNYSYFFIFLSTISKFDIQSSIIMDIFFCKYQLHMHPLYGNIPLRHYYLDPPHAMAVFQNKDHGFSTPYTIFKSKPSTTMAENKSLAGCQVSQLFIQRLAIQDNNAPISCFIGSKGQPTKMPHLI